MIASFYYKTPAISFGLDAAKQVGDHAKKMGAKKVGIVTGPSVCKTEGLEIVKESLKKASLDSDVFILERGGGEPGPEHPEQTSDYLKKGGFDLAVGLGGGSVIDTTKVAAAMVNNPGKTSDFYGVDKMTKKGLPTIMMPTTSGTGADITKSALFVDKQLNVKKAVAGNILTPDLAIIDPLLTLSSPPGTTASCGLDAWIHAAESYIASSATALTDSIALEAVAAITRWLGPAFADGNNLEARAQMAMGSTMAGIVLNNAGVNFLHAMSFPLGGEFHTSHGTTLCGILVAGFEAAATANQTKLARLGAAMGENVLGLSAREAVEVTLDAIFNLLKSVELPTCLPDLGITDKSSAQRWAEEAYAERRLFARSASAFTVEQLKRIFLNAFEPRYKD